MPYFESSAKERLNVEESFHELVRWLKVISRFQHSHLAGAAGKVFPSPRDSRSSGRQQIPKREKENVQHALKCFECSFVSVLHVMSFELFFHCTPFFSCCFGFLAPTSPLSSILEFYIGVSISNEYIVAVFISLLCKSARELFSLESRVAQPLTNLQMQLQTQHAS